jgi:hypothetical protein
MAGIIDVFDKDEIYQVEEIRSIRDIKRLFPDDYEPRNNWLFCSTQGAHGTRKTIEDVEDILHREDGGKYWITVLVIQPRLCNLFYGDISVAQKDLPLLRKLVRNTLDVIPKTQRGNV